MTGDGTGAISNAPRLSHKHHLHEQHIAHGSTGDRQDIAKIAPGSTCPRYWIYFGVGRLELKTRNGKNRVSIVPNTHIKIVIACCHKVMPQPLLSVSTVFAVLSAAQVYRSSSALKSCPPQRAPDTQRLTPAHPLELVQHRNPVKQMPRLYHQRHKKHLQRRKRRQQHAHRHKFETSSKNRQAHDQRIPEAELGHIHINSICHSQKPKSRKNRNRVWESTNQCFFHFTPTIQSLSISCSISSLDSKKSFVRRGSKSVPEPFSMISKHWSTGMASR